MRRGEAMKKLNINHLLGWFIFAMWMFAFIYSIISQPIGITTCTKNDLFQNITAGLGFIAMNLSIFWAGTLVVSKSKEFIP
jgi:hypothetical protein